METSLEITGTPINTKLFSALAKAQGQFAEIAKNRTGKVTYQLKDSSGQSTGQKSSYEFRYADLQAILSATRPALAANGLALIQPIRQQGTANLLETILLHESGEQISSAIVVPDPSKFNDVKQYGGHITYLRRYMVTALLGVAADDDLDENDAPAATPTPSGQPGLTPQSTDAQQPQNEEPAPAGEATATEGLTAGMLKTLQLTIEKSQKGEADVCTRYGVSTLAEIPRSKINEAIEFVKGN